MYEWAKICTTPGFAYIFSWKILFTSGGIKNENDFDKIVLSGKIKTDHFLNALNWWFVWTAEPYLL
jgi:hypothetical protein